MTVLNYIKFYNCWCRITCERYKTKSACLRNYLKSLKLKTPCAHKSTTNAMGYNRLDCLDCGETLKK